MRKNRIIITLLCLVLFFCAIFPQKVSAARLPSFNLTTINGDTITNASDNGKTKLFVFFRTDCYNSKSTIRNLADAVWANTPNLKIYAADIDGVSTTKIEDFSKNYEDNENITFCTGNNSSTMWNLLYIAGFTGNSVSLPVCIAVDNDGIIHSYTTGYQSTDDLWDFMRESIIFPTVDVSITGTYDYKKAFEVLDIVNQEREANGLTPLKMDQTLLTVAMQRAAEGSIYFSHTRPNGKSCFSVPGFTGGYRGENIASGYSTSAGVMNGWMNSPGHRGNILNSNYSSIGIGVFYQNGVISWVQVFSTKKPTVASVSEKKTQTATIEVQDYADYWKLFGEENLKVGVPSELSLYAGYTLGRGSKIDPSSLTFTSSNPAVATINASGIITPLKAGTVTFTVSALNSTTVKELTATVTTKLTISKQPKDACVSVGTTASVSVTATGDNLKYQWYYRNPGDSYFTKSSMTGKTYQTTLTQEKSGRKVYCVITDKYGNSIKTNTVTLSVKAKITKQPTNASGAVGKNVVTSVSAIGKGLSYQWYYTDNASDKTFSKSSNTTATYSTKMTSDRNGRKVYCVITDQYGNKVTSKTVTLSVKATITTQPKSVTVASGSTAKATVKATGDGLSYQWYYTDNASDKTFSKSSNTTATYSIQMNSARDGRKVYCVITDKYGNTVKTNTVTLSIKKTAKITTQPKSVTVASGSTAKATVKATGDGLTYQWYYTDNASDKTFSKSSITSATYSTTMTSARNGRKVYCVITDKYGNKVTTNTVTLKMK